MAAFAQPYHLAVRILRAIARIACHPANESVTRPVIAREPTSFRLPRGKSSNLRCTSTEWIGSTGHASQ